MSDEIKIRFNLMIAPSQSAEINRYLVDVGSLASKGEAIREFIALGLKEHWEKKGKGD